LGAYAKGSDPRVDRAMAALPEIERFVCQDAEPTRFAAAAAELGALAKKFG
jgi:flagellar biosynthesis/type III secretory pathway ATPase